MRARGTTDPDNPIPSAGMKSSVPSNASIIIKILSTMAAVIAGAFAVWFTITSYVEAQDVKVIAQVDEVKEMVLATNQRIEEGTLSDAIMNIRRELRDWRRELRADPGNQVYKDEIGKLKEELGDLEKKRDNLRGGY